MKTIIIITAVMLLSALRIIAQNNYITHKGYASFFSEAPVADVDARNDKVKAELNTSTNEVSFAIDMNDFQFKSKKMGRDARKNYIEIDKYPKASFNGKINDKIDYAKSGSYPVTATGELKVHGVGKKVTEKGTLTVNGKQIKIESEFRVALKDHNIETPKILGKEMTQDYVIVKVEATLSERARKEVSKK